MDQTPNPTATNSRTANVLVNTILMTGLLLPTVLGLIVRVILLSQGRQVVSLSEGAIGIIVPTIAIFILFSILAGFALHRFTIITEKFQNGEWQSQHRKWVYIIVGAFIGMTIVVGYRFFTILLSMNYVEVVIYTIFYLIPVYFIYALFASLAGGIIGWVVWRLSNHTYLSK